MSKPIYCTYLTVYKGNKLPPFYIGSTSVVKINNGYRGSVKSKKYKEIWKSELKNNPNLFTTKIVTIHDSRQEALDKEDLLHKKLNVVKSPMYINMSFASKNGYFGTSLSRYGQDAPFYGKTHTTETKMKISNSLCGTSNHMYGKTHSQEARKNISLKLSGNKNGSFGKGWFYNPSTYDSIKCFPENKPENYIPGRKIKPRITK
jgi:hypothetical protein